MSGESPAGGDEDPSFEDAFETSVAVRYDDLDTYGHVNNAAFATVLEEARIDYLEAALSEVGDATALTAVRSDGPGLVVANLGIDFRSPLGPAESVTVGVDVPRLGESSLPMAYQLRAPADDSVVAVGETTMVVVDRSNGESRPIPDGWREAIEAFEDGLE